MAIQVAPTTPVRVLISEIFLVISAVPIWIIFRETVTHMLAVNADIKIIVAVVVMVLHAGNVVVEEDVGYQKLILIVLTPAAKDVAAEDVVHIMALALE